jgi:hypothetical protein
MKGTKNSLEKSTKILYDTNFTKCEYFDICGYARTGCDEKNNKEECGLWHNWHSVDLNNLFKEKVDNDKNYLLDL